MSKRITVPAEVVPKINNLDVEIILYLHEEQPARQYELSEQLGYSENYISERVNMLLSHEVIQREDSKISLHENVEVVV